MDALYFSLVVSLFSVIVRKDVSRVYIVSGDLAEVALFQGPIMASGMNMGPSGKWDDNLFFRNYTLDIDSTSRYEFTDAEMRGGLDGKFACNRKVKILISNNRNSSSLIRIVGYIW